MSQQYIEETHGPIDESHNESYWRARKYLALADLPPGEEVVISGISGTYPEARNVYELRDKLMNKEDMVTRDDRRWDLIYANIPEYSGKLPDLEKFDAGFFGIPKKSADTMDPQCRKSLENVVAAVMDAGLNPSELAGARCGTFYSAGMSETEYKWTRERLIPKANSLLGLMRSMIINRVSYHLKLNGPSYVTDTACSSSLVALCDAYHAIRLGLCDSAIVVGTQLCLHPFTTLQFSSLGVLNSDGKSKTFDAKADGYTRSEVVCTVFLQKAKDARRQYAKLVHVKANSDGFTEQGITYPNGEIQQRLIKEVSAERHVDPLSIGYFEAHGTSTRVGDPEEVINIDRVLNTGVDRKTPLLIGSVKSNLGHAEAASGICSLSKTSIGKSSDLQVLVVDLRDNVKWLRVDSYGSHLYKPNLDTYSPFLQIVIAMETGYIPPNIHYYKPRAGVEALEKGRMKVVTEATRIPNDGKGAIVGINNFGFGGSNVHGLLQQHLKDKQDGGVPKDDLPRLVCLNGRIPETITSIVNEITNKPLDGEYVGLLHKIFRNHIEGNYYKGYLIASKYGVIEKSIPRLNEETRELYIGFGSFNGAWRIITKDLLTLPLFKETLIRIHKIVAPKQVDIVSMINGYANSEVNSSIFGNMVVQLCLVDILKAVDVKTSKVFGDSIGELVCAYYDGVVDLEEVVLMGYELAKCLNKSDSRHVMRVNGVSKKADVDINSEGTKEISNEPVAVAGMVDSINKYARIMNGKHEDISVNEQDVRNEDVRKHRTELVKRFKQIIRNPRKKSEIWLNNSEMTTVDAEYLVNALITPVDYNKLKDTVPMHTVFLELGSRQMTTILNTILKYKSVETVRFDYMDGAENLVCLLSALGSVYTYGFDMALDELYPKVAFPVSRGTPMVSPHIKYNHSADWPMSVQRYEHKQKSGNIEDRIHYASFDINIKMERYRYITGHIIDGLNLFPATGYIFLVMETFIKMHKIVYHDTKVKVENCKFHRATSFPKDGNIILEVMINIGSGNFEVSERSTSLVTGTITLMPKDEFIHLPEREEDRTDDEILMRTKDIYKELRLRGYSYRELFKSLVECDSKGRNGRIQWRLDLVSFMDNMLQMKILQLDSRGLFVPTYIDKFLIDIQRHTEHTSKEADMLPVRICGASNVISCGGIEIQGLQASPITRRKPLSEPVLEKYEFVANETQLQTTSSMRVNMQLLLENEYAVKVKVVELVDEASRRDLEPLATDIGAAFSDQPLITTTLLVLCSDPELPQMEGVTVETGDIASQTDCTLIVGSRLLTRPSVTNQAFGALKDNGSLLSREPLDSDPHKTTLPNVNILTVHTTNTEKLVLFKRDKHFAPSTVIQIAGEQFEWLQDLKTAIKEDRNIVIYSQNEPVNGIIGLLNCIRREPGGNKVRCFFIVDVDAPKFDLNKEFYKTQLERNLAFNVLKNGKWGTLRHLLLEEADQVECEHCLADTAVKGDLNSLTWIEGPLSTKKPLDDPNKELVHVHYSALNFKDVMLGSGRLNAENSNTVRTDQNLLLGLEYSGCTADGQRVMGMVDRGGIATIVSADRNFLFNVPDHWSLEDAATVPCVYMTVLYAFYRGGGIRKGESILIHSGAGGIGQAAINIAVHHGVEVFTTVGTPEKREFIKKTWPIIDDAHIGNSRDCSFEQMILEQTNGRGIDIVLNSLSEEKLITTARCLAKGGRFLEIGKFDFESNNRLAVALLEKEGSYHGVMLDMFFGKKSSDKVLLKELLYEGMRNGSVKPLRTHLFEKDQLVDAFKFMSSGKHIGKVVIKIRDEKNATKPKSARKVWKAAPRYSCDAKETYIICGGLGGFGLELADWLVIRGARNLVLTSRTGVKNGYQASRIRIWKSYGTKVHISTSDITTREGCLKLINSAKKLGPICGIFNLAVILRDALLEDQTAEEFRTSFAPKAHATAHLDALSRQLCPELRSFVVFSSVSCGRGNPGQTNYGMANSVMERICEKRRQDGLPALAIQWGAVGDVGLVADMQEEDRELEIGGTLQQRITSCLEVMDVFLKQNNPVVSSMVVAEKLLSNAENCVDAVAAILGIKNLKTISFQVTLAELGMDSMRAVEVKQTLERDFDIILTAKEVRTLTFTRLQELNKSGDVPANTTKKVMNEGALYIVELVDEDLSESNLVVQLPTAILETAKAPKVTLLPGIEGVANTLKPLARNLRCHAAALQYAYQTDGDIKGAAQTLLQYVDTNAGSGEPIKMIGYSFGCVLAMEITSMLEAEGKGVKLVLIDGYPEVVTRQLGGIKIDETFDTQLIFTIMSMFCTEKIVSENMEKITKCKCLEEQIRTASDVVLGEVKSQQSRNNLHRVLFSMHRHLKSGCKYTPTYTKIKSSVMLFKPETQLRGDLPEDYGLQIYCEQELKIHTIDGNHTTMLENPDLARAINEFFAE